MVVIKGDSIDPLIWQRVKYFSNIRKAVSYVDEHISERINLREVAGAAGQEATAFSKSFRAKTGVRFRDFAQALRIMRAIEKMTECDYSLTEIAFAVGFNNLETFGRTFRKIMGTSPSAYRKSILVKRGIARVAS